MQSDKELALLSMGRPKDVVGWLDGWVVGEYRRLRSQTRCVAVGLGREVIQRESKSVIEFFG